MKSWAWAALAAAIISSIVASGAVGDVFADGGREQQRGLQHNANLVAQGFQIELAHIDPSITCAPFVTS
jgi:hypothetical protein